MQFAQLFGLQGCTVVRWENPEDELRPTPFHLGLIELLDQAGRRRPRRRGAGNDIVAAIDARGAARALAELLAEALRADASTCLAAD